MRVLHITNEFTKKNYSIASLILFISQHLYKNFKINFSLLASKTNKSLFNEDVFTDSRFNKWLNFILINRELTNNFFKYDIIHIHGIWAPIQIFSILICNKQKLNYVIHPHGMLLPEALKSGGIIKFFFKSFTLFFLKKIIKSKLNFISITNQETIAIKKYFPKAHITNISNPIPFHISKVKNYKQKKKFVYFGRIHPHKNLEILIKSFLDADLDNSWSLDIYGIRDDENYFYKLKKLIGHNNQIKIKDPIFNENKQQVMKDAWANVLVSKSEVVSLSILESSAYGLPSLINKNIEVSGLENSVITTNLSLESIKNKIIEISKWSYEKRTLIGKSISETINIKSSIDSISKKYRNFYNSIDYRIEEEYPKKLDFYNLLKSENINFLMVSGSYMFNLMFPSLLIIMFVIVGKFSIAGEIGLVASFWITLTQIFSSNMRSIIISEQKIDYAVMTAYFRIAFSIIFFLIFFQFSNNFFNFENSNLIVLISILILSQWINEMNLVKLELKDNNIKFILITLFNTLITITALILIFYSKIDYLFYLISVYVVYILFESSRNFLESKIIKKNIIQFIFKLNIQTIAFLSSFSIIISSFAWKFMIYFIFNKSIAGIFLLVFQLVHFQELYLILLLVRPI